MEKIIHCLLCNSNEKSLFDKRNMLGQEISNQICKNCGFVYLSPRMTEEELDKFYKNQYRTLYHGQEAPTDADLNTQQQRADHLLSFARENQLKISRHLDIGSSAGILLKTFREGFDCAVVGVEPGDGYRMHNENQQLTIYPSLDALREKGEDKFDLISMSHVLEHIPDPTSFLSELCDLLTEDGVVLVEVPNLFGHTSFEISHLTSFSKHTLGEIFNQSGYDTIQLKVHGNPRSKILPLYLTILAKPQEGIKKRKVVPEKLVPIKRKIGMFNQKVMGRLFPSKAWLPKI